MIFDDCNDVSGVESKARMPKMNAQRLCFPAIVVAKPTKHSCRDREPAFLKKTDFFYKLKAVTVTSCDRLNIYVYTVAITGLMLDSN